MKTCTRVSIGLLLGIVLIVVSGDTAAQTADPSSGGRRGEFLGLSPSQAKELRRKLESTIRERAVLESVHTVEIRSEVAGSMTILRLVPEASVVKKGDLLVQLDGSSLQEEMLKQRAAVAQARAALRQIELANAVADQQRTNGVAVAKLAAKVAELDRNKYLAKGGEFELALKKIESEMAIAQQMLDLAQNAIKSAEQAVEKGMADRQAVDKAQLAAAEARAELVTAGAARQLLTEHLRDHRTATLDLAVLQTKSALAQIQSQSELAWENTREIVVASKAALELEEVKLAALSSQIEGCRIYAPRDGLVIFASPSTRGADAIEEGAVVQQRQLILKMPDMSRLQARLFVHESRIGRVRKGQPVRIGFDAFPDRTFHGTVAQLSDFPEPPNWYRADVKEYAVLVSLEDAAAELKLGMTALAEIDVSQSGRE